MTNFSVADDKAPLAFFEKNGYYVVGNKIFNHKINALEEATKQNLPVTWEFNSSVYKSQNWLKPVPLDLQTLYKIRAQQLRDQYQYLVLSYSGGADSTTALKSFLENNIHLDEIIVDWSLSKTVGQYSVTTDTRPENYISEWDLAIKPMLDHVKTHYPKTKITVTDSIETLTVEDYEDTCTLTQIHNYVSIKRYRKISQRLRELNDQHASVALVLGVDKPILYVKNNFLCARFTDSMCWFKSSLEKYPRNIEYFYWTPSLPEIVVKQAQMLYNHVKANPNLLECISSNSKPMISGDQYNQLNKIVKSLIYPNWDTATFQANKGNSLIYNEQYAWFFEKPKTIEIESWESSMHSRLKPVAPEYLQYFADGRFYGYRRFFSSPYPIGNI